ncbi:histone-lysine N-methyltransferase [Achlya hypogyna]|uniref:Histone-lysine N-methyltransferase n=1 Tax=Achlya hypogyna TaxID=1202772 RepID=A0A1V9Z8T1_ACHHY|nr:histone-lysine N-methyltransferase [Achlya hypogyna]
MQRSCEECHLVVPAGAEDEWRCGTCRGTFHAPCVRNKRRTKTMWQCSACAGRRQERGLLLADAVKKLIQTDDEPMDDIWEQMQQNPGRAALSSASSSPDEGDEKTTKSHSAPKPRRLTENKGAIPMEPLEPDVPIRTNGVCSSCGLTTIPEMHIMTCCTCQSATAHTLCMQNVNPARWNCPGCFERAKDQSSRRNSRQRVARTDHVILMLDEPLDDATVVLCDNCSGEFSMAHLGMRVVPSGQWFCVHCDVASHPDVLEMYELDADVAPVKARATRKPSKAHQSPKRGEDIIDLALDDDSDNNKAPKARKRKRDTSPTSADTSGKASALTSSKAGKRATKDPPARRQTWAVSAAASPKSKKSKKAAGGRSKAPAPVDDDDQEEDEGVTRQPLRIVIPDPLLEKPKRVDDVATLRALHKYVGRSVFVRLQDDEPWVLGDVIAFDPHRLLFRVDLQDATTQMLPLHELPIAIGTNVNVFVRLDALDTWWPAQKMELNELAAALFGPKKEVAEALLLVYAPPFQVPYDGAPAWPHDVCLWAPLGTLRCFDTFLQTTKAPDDVAWQEAVQHAYRANERRIALVKDAHDRLSREIQKHFDGKRWVGKQVVVVEYATHTTHEGRLTKMDKVPGGGVKYWLEKSDGQGVYVVPPTPTTTTSVAASAWTWVCPLSFVELSMQWYLDADAVLDLASVEEPVPVVDLGSPKNEAAPKCATCLFPLAAAAVVACSVCTVATHKACISPPYEAYPLVDKDGTELVADLELRYVCGGCRACDGCGSQDVATWHLFETKLARLYLCEPCSTEYASHQYCPVCLKTHTQGFCADVLQCTSCDLWAHGECEPDPDPMYHPKPPGKLDDDATDFLDFSVGALDPTDVCPDDVSTDKLRRKWHDDRVARALGFKPKYDPRAMAKYECASCRQLRLYKLLHALRAEDKFGIFSEPVTVDIAPTYFDIIKAPMDLSTMARNVRDRVYVHGLGADFRDHFELLCLNAVTFNSKERDFLVWREAWRFYNAGVRLLRQIFPAVLLVPSGRYTESIAAAAKRQLPTNSSLVAKDEPPSAVPAKTKLPPEDGSATPLDSPLLLPSPSPGSDDDAESASLASADNALTVRPDMFKLPTELGPVPKPYSCIASVVAMQSLAQAHLLAWLDACVVCCSTGVPEKLIFCIDCGEGYHQFCLHPPLDLAENPVKQAKLQAFWRCPNCKLCELCGTNKDEAKLLVCDACERGVHTFCLRPKLRDVPATGFVCGSCIDCATCHAPQESTSWSPTVACCLGCMDDATKDALLGVPKKPRARPGSDGNVCPACTKKWSESETLIQCDGCQSWVHPACDSISEETLAALTDESEYYCPPCRKKQRKHLKAFRKAWGLQLNIALIQEKRQEIVATWQAQLSHRQTLRQYEHWRSYAPVYLYILRLGEECLKGLAGRRISFLVQAPSTGISVAMIPLALRQAASRYLRFKRYARGPRAAARREQRKKQNFFTVEGVDATPTAIAHVVSEAVGAASFLACCTWLYGMKRVSLFTAGLLDAHELPQPLKDALIDRSAVSIDAEVASINTEYARRKQLRADEPAPTQEAPAPAKPPPVVIEIPDEPEAPAKEAVPSTVEATAVAKVDRVPETPTHTALAKMTCAPAMRGWGAWEATLGEFVDPRVCGLCREPGDDPRFAGRLVFADFDQWVHVNCIAWSSEVYEDAYGVLKLCQKARVRGRLHRCAECGLSGATVGCHGLRCQLNFHLHCAQAHLVFTTETQAFCTDHWKVHLKKTQDKKRKRDDDLAARKKAKGVDVPSPASGDEPSEVAACLNDLVEQVVAVAALETATPGREPLRFLMCEQDPPSGKAKRLSKTQLAKGVCYRVGALTVHALGTIEVGNDAFHTVSTLYPVGFRSTRIFWSAVTPQQRCLYECEILAAPTKKPLFRITPSDDMDRPIVGASPNDAMNQLRSRVLALYESKQVFSVGWNPFLRRSSWFSYGLIGDHFFGLSVPVVGAALEALPMAPTAALFDPLSNPHPYVFCHVLPSEATFDEARTDLRRLLSIREHAQQSSGSIRTDGYHGWQQSKAIKPSAKKRTVGLSKHADEPAAGNSKPSVDLEQLPIAMQYRELRKRPFDERLEVRKSRIHGYGLFVKEVIAEGKMIVEYQGQAIRQKVADLREKRYEEMGIGSCYMFRLDADTIVDATRTGNLARFINHSCDPKANARIITIDGNEKKIIIFAKQTLHVGDEVTYDYKFPIEDEAIRCDCGAVNCIGRMN